MNTEFSFSIGNTTILENLRTQQALSEPLSQTQFDSDGVPPISLQVSLNSKPEFEENSLPKS